MRLILAFVFGFGVVLTSTTVVHAQANAEATVYQGERPARALLIQAGMLDTTAVATDTTALDAASSTAAPLPETVPVPDAAPTPGPVALPPIDPTPLFYVVDRAARLRSSPDDRSPVVERLPMREGVRVLSDSVGSNREWHHVRYGETEGYVQASALSNLWIRINKTERTVYLYEGAELVRTFPADVSAGTGDKVRRSRLGELEHYRIPEGTFFVVRLHGESEYYKAFVINYPNTAHAERGLRDGLITPVQFRAIAAAEQTISEPPMGTPLGGLIEIHGSGSGRQRAWTRGCVALRNIHMDDLWDIVKVGTPVIIEP
ncbi:MAG: L,D-transpeptidase family protein [Rubricoccaceae bacterium]